MLTSNGDYLSVPDTSDWQFKGKDFIIDFWYKFKIPLWRKIWSKIYHWINPLKGQTIITMEKENDK